MPFQAVMVRRQDGLAKQWTTTVRNANGHFTKPGVRVQFTSVHALHALDGSTGVLRVCEKTDVDIMETQPFVRSLPGLLRHKLFFGDLLFVSVGGGGEFVPFTTNDFKQIMDGDHPAWSVRGIRDVSQQSEVFDTTEVSEDEEENEEEDDDPIAVEEEEEEELVLEDSNNEGEEEEEEDDDDD